MIWQASGEPFTQKTQNRKLLNLTSSLDLMCVDENLKCCIMHLSSVQALLRIYSEK